MGHQLFICFCISPFDISLLVLMLKSRVQTGMKKTLLQQVQQSIQLLNSALPDLQQGTDELSIKNQRKQLLQAIRALQIIKRAVNMGTPQEKLEFLSQEHYLDLVILGLRLNLEYNFDELQKVQTLILDILEAHQLDQPSTDHLFLIHENILPSLNFYFVRTVLQQNFKQTCKIALFLYNASFSNYNPKILMYDQNCIYIFQNILNLEENQSHGQEYYVDKAIEYVIDTLIQLSKTGILNLGIQHLYSQLIIQCVTQNELNEDIKLKISTLFCNVYDKTTGIYEQELSDLQSIVTLFQNETCPVTQKNIKDLNELMVTYL